jgi:hypothetical protein
MTVIELADDKAAILEAEAAKYGLSLSAWVEKLAAEMAITRSREPLRIPRNILAPYGPAPTAEEIDENRREMLQGFAEKF